ncbi:MAG: substrate-binding domain-containing protein [Anaerolineae bacterium]|nr:substrate-binding domain-containing protein [Anaerolineae bacterium]
MKRGSVFVILFVLIALAVIGASQFLRSQPPLEITFAVSPLAQAWVSASAESFNATNPLLGSGQRIAVHVQPVDDPAVWNDSTRAFSAQQHPQAWIPALASSVDYAVDARLPLVVIAPETAHTLLVWGIFESRAAVAESDTTAALDWQRVQQIADAESWATLGGDASWGFVKLIFSRPSTTAGGLGVLFSGAGAYFGTTDLEAASLSDTAFREWMQRVLNSVPNFNTIGADPAAALTRGPSTGEIALLPESQWLVNLSGIVQREPVLFSYPAYTVLYQFPVALWDAPEMTSIERDAVYRFADWLQTPGEQARAIEFGLRPLDGNISETAALFAAGETYGIVLTPDMATTVTPPTRNEVLRMINWAG